MKTTRGDCAPWTVTQSTATNDRLCSMLSALLLRRPAPPLENRLPWQLFDPKQQQQARNIFLIVVQEDNDADEDLLLPALQKGIQSSSWWFCAGLRVVGCSRKHDANEKAHHFAQQWSRLMTTLNHDTTDIYVITGSLSALHQLSQQLLMTEQNPRANVKGILSILDTGDSCLPHLPDETFHWMIQINMNSPTVARQGALAVATHSRSFCLTLPSHPPTLWLVRAVIWFAHAVQVITTTTTTTSHSTQQQQQQQPGSSDEQLSSSSRMTLLPVTRARL